MSIPDKKVIGGKTYNWYNTYWDGTQANKSVRRLRAQGYKVRVVSLGKRILPFSKRKKTLYGVYKRR